MYAFALMGLLALASLKVVDFVCDNVEPLERFRSLLVFAAAIGAVVWLDFSVFAEWGLEVRNATLGVWMTGVIVTGLTVPWRAVFQWVTHDKATGDEALGEHMGFLRRVS